MRDKEKPQRTGLLRTARRIFGDFVELSRDNTRATTASPRTSYREVVSPELVQVDGRSMVMMRFADEKSKPAILTSEVAVGDSDLITYVDMPGFNPDSLVSKKGLQIYDSMITDDQIRGALAVKKYSLLSRPYGFKPASKSAQDVQIAEYLTKSVERMPGAFVSKMMGMLTALDYGYSINEKIYVNEKEGEYAGKMTLKNVKSRKPHSFSIEVDDYSNITELKQEQKYDMVELPVDKFIIYTYESRWESPYGTSDLKAAYEAWWAKTVILRFWNMFLEKYPTPIMLGKFPQGTSDEIQDRLMTVLEDLQFSTVAKMPDNLEIEVIQMKGTAADVFERAVTKRDRMICRAMLVPDLLGMGDITKGGSYALGKKQFSLFYTMLVFVSNQFQELLQESMVHQWVDLNFKVNAYPQFYFGEFDEHSIEEKAKILNLLGAAGYLDPTDPEVSDWARRWMNIMPNVDGEGSSLAKQAFDYSHRLISPDGKDAFYVNIAEDVARLEMLEDALRKG